MAAPVVVQAVPTIPLGNVASAPVTFLSPTVTGNSIVVQYGGYNSSSRSGQLTCTDTKSNTYTLTKFDERTNGSRFQVTATFHCHNATGGAAHVVTVGGLAGSYCNAAASEVSGLNTGATPLTASNGASTSTNPATATSGTTSATSVADAISFAVLDFDNDGSGGIVTPSGYTSIYLSNGGNECGSAAYKILSATGTQSASWGSAINPGSEAGTWSGQIAVFETTASGSTRAPSLLLLGA